MNRKQRRALERKVKRNGFTEQNAKEYVKLINNASAIINGGVGDITPPKPFNEGDKILLDIPKIKARKNYNRMSDKYKEFVESSEGVVFTAHVEQNNLISMQENPTWLFWSGDLNRAEVEET